MSHTICNYQGKTERPQRKAAYHCFLLNTLWETKNLCLMPSFSDFKDIKQYNESPCAFAHQKREKEEKSLDNSTFLNFKVSFCTQIL